MPASKFTAARGARIIEALEKGHYLDHAAALAGVHRSTVYRWIEKGEKAKTGRMRAFADAVRAADAEAVDYALEAIHNAMPDSPQAAQWFLERRHPTKFAKVERQEVTGEGGGPIRIELKWPIGPQAPSEQ